MEETVSPAADATPTSAPSTGSVAVNPGALLAVAAILALLVSVVAFSTHHIGLGVSAASVALLATGAALSWLSAEARRLRDAEPLT